MFNTHHNLQGSQTAGDFSRQKRRFNTHHNLQGSQTYAYDLRLFFRLTPIIIYKVLKPQIPICSHRTYPSDDGEIMMCISFYNQTHIPVNNILFFPLQSLTLKWLN